MKKRQLSQKKISAADVIGKSQTKISSFFMKVPKTAASDDKIVSDVNSLSQASIEKKRKERDNAFDEEFRVSAKKKRNASEEPLKEHHAAGAENFESQEDSVLLSALKDLEEPYSRFKENRVACEDAVLQKTNKKEEDAAAKSEQNGSALPNSAGIKGTNVSDVTHVLKEQDLNTVAPKSSLSTLEMTRQRRDKVHDLKKAEDAFEDFSTMMNGDELDDFFDQEWHPQVDLTTLQRCKIVDVRHESRVTVLTVQHLESENIDTVACSGFWKDARVRVNDTVTIQAARDGSRRWIVDDKNGFLVTQPDLLISGTTVTGGLFCRRRAVLAEKFRKIESLPNLHGDYSVMTVGSLVHQWLQKALRENICVLSDVIRLLDDILRSKDTLDYLYASELSLVECRKRMMEYAPRIFEFIQHYVRGNRQRRISDLRDNFRGSIDSVRDIEESVYIPKLGIKGRIDVTAEVNIDSRRKIMPLEVKTGRASYSLEHKGQVILYLMMMGFRDRDIDTGLLLYLKENTMREIRSGHNEKRDLILLRNTLAHYFARKPEDLQGVDTAADLRAMELPEPINHHSACDSCPYRNLCCAYLARDANANLSPSHPLTALIKELRDSVETRHLDYVMKWIALLQLEESHENDSSSLSSVWTTSPEKRETRGTCICNVKIVGRVVEQGDRYRHKFARVNIKGETVENGTFGGAFAEDNYVIVSTDARVNIAAGHIMYVSHDVVAVLLDKDITRLYPNSTFHIDKYPSTGLATFNYANVAGLLSNDETSVKLRRVVIDRRPATFVEKLPRSTVSAGARIISDLNENQQRAVLKAVAAHDYVLIKGMPGTGKTQTLVALIELLLELGSSVLITAHTHSAVDNVLLKLLERDIDFLRLGSTKQIHPLLTCKSEEYAIASCDTPEDLETLYNGKRIVGVTCYGAYHALLRRRTFDVCVVDESAQIMQPTVLRPLYSARKFVLVGDPDQLPPVVKSRTAASLGADESLFVRLDGDDSTVNLWRQYRMNGRIMRLANDATYRGKLVSGSRQVENATLTGTNMERVLASCERWIRSALSGSLDDSVVLLDTGRTYKLNEESVDGNVTSDQAYSNIWEVAITSRLVQVLTEAGVCARNIGIIAPYNAHINLLRKIIDKEVEVNTVDQYQGRDKDVILYSCTKSVECDKKKQFEILDDQRRLTVAITRARHKLIIIADKVTLLRYTPFKSLFDVIDEKNVINLRDGEEDFSWKKLIRRIDTRDKEFKEF
ncbi:PREDICTED: DNA replication ATP-dependent helicase/nuclease DNA2 isoform X2 [Wasmannia auropunctata]|uniref:DNA replication ATP-dependent helicase/nuclease DNA2 isoform X2 n=1 Tax=Wasmannia auropunctata TaxID=64793 RepID=UPI0005EEC1A1|nr:PREDICTED: DNA replication ATP-dependent helicase/nuclease DNA2 isoform X2 [Wasmannia auropunctata]